MTYQCVEFRNALVAYKDEFQREYMSELLRRLGVPFPTSVSSGKTLLQTMREITWDLVVTAFDMPGASALEVIDVLSETDADTRVIVCGLQEPRMRTAIEEYARAKCCSGMVIASEPMGLGGLAGLLATGSNLQPLDCSIEAEVPATRSDLHAALDAGDVMVYFQPQHCLTSGALVGAELLVRWHHPTLGILGPHRFLATLEAAGLGLQLIDVLLDTVTRLCNTLGNPIPIKFAINIPARHATSAAYAERLVDRLRKSGTSCSNVVIEVTEDGSNDEDGDLAGAIAHWRVRGLDCAIDDFGTGSSSLNRLCVAPFTLLKIDRAMVWRARTTQHVRSLLKCTATAAHKLEMSVVAEGIETVDDLELVRKLGCDVAQGSYFGSAMPEKAFRAYIEAPGVALRGWRAPLW